MAGVLDLCCAATPSCHRASGTCTAVRTYVRRARAIFYKPTISRVRSLFAAHARPRGHLPKRSNVVERLTGWIWQLNTRSEVWLILRSRHIYACMRMAFASPPAPHAHASSSPPHFKPTSLPVHTSPISVYFSRSYPGVRRSAHTFCGAAASPRVYLSSLKCSGAQVSRQIAIPWFGQRQSP